jgi:hypothetical protein
MRTTKLLAATAMIAALVTQAQAAGIMSCTVADPGTPLNLRSSPNGAILGAAHNGTIVIVQDLAVWSAARSGRSAKPGWVFFNYLEDCQGWPLRP